MDLRNICQSLLTVHRSGLLPDLGSPVPAYGGASWGPFVLGQLTPPAQRDGNKASRGLSGERRHEGARKVQVLRDLGENAGACQCRIVLHGADEDCQIPGSIGLRARDLHPWQARQAGVPAGSLACEFSTGPVFVIVRGPAEELERVNCVNPVARCLYEEIPYTGFGPAVRAPGFASARGAPLQFVV